LAESTKAAREKKAAKRARRKERDAALKAVEEPPSIAAVSRDAAATTGSPANGVSPSLEDPAPLRSPGAAAADAMI